MADIEKPPSPELTSDTAVGSDEANDSEKKSSGPGPKSVREDGKIECTEEDNYEHTAYMFLRWKKWMILNVIFAVQVSMNFNTSIYSNVVNLLTVRFVISRQAIRTGQMIFLVCYAFVCELWVPWSEEFGRWPILQLSLFLFNIWQIPRALAPKFGTIVVCRGLGGLSSAGGSVTPGMVADLFEADHQQYGAAFIVLSSVGSTGIGPVFGALIQRYLSQQRNFWIQLIFGVVVQLAPFFLVPETRSTVLIDKLANKRPKAGETDIWGPNELKETRISAKDLGEIWTRPFIMLVSEPIVLCLSLLSGFSDALIFTLFRIILPVYKQWGLGIIAIGLAFVTIMCNIHGDYMVASYGASATGGNGIARDFLAGIAAMYNIRFYEKVGTTYHLE